MGLDNPMAKMSKSDQGAKGHAVRLDDSNKDIEKAFKRAVTDSGREISFNEDPERAGVNNLLGIYSAVTGASREQSEKDFVDARGYGDLKMRVAEVVIEALEPIRERYEELLDDRPELDRLLKIGADQARAVSEPKIAEVKERVGFLV